MAFSVESEVQYFTASDQIYDLVRASVVSTNGLSSCLAKYRSVVVSNLSPNELHAQAVRDWQCT